MTKSCQWWGTGLNPTLLINHRESGALWISTVILQNSSIAASLTSLLKVLPKNMMKRLSWESLQRPQVCIPISTFFPAIHSGGGHITGDKPNVHPVGFYSHKLSTAECNSNVGKREMLAVKLVLERWRHWLEKAAHPFIVLTDHTNLVYLKTLKPMPSQVDLYLLTYFNFCMYYCQPFFPPATSTKFSGSWRTSPENKKYVPP